jgi:hypothetical protein
LKSARAALRTILFLGLVASPALAQDPATSTIAGTVTDASGAPIAGARVTGFANVLARDSSEPADPGFLRSSSFGRALTTAGGVFGAGGPRAFQLGMRLQF